MKSIKELIKDWLIASTKESTLRCIALNEDAVRKQMYQEAGKPIEELSCIYPATPQDAAIIFEEWCKGILSEYRPTIDTLKQYAAYTASKEAYLNWVHNY